ncbi:YihY family inner membrane protein [Undibacterium sp. RTI2.1]|uniref:YihY family inner membrane protein n=1 Tax=unclassified Undibacterium TaxID=2630295 RepID=UPI002AB40D90|nr:MULTISPECIES: YihY family inner membrane protein [unclassified Undibacterium]MDY7538227.1 YihY family inner membrane protein [Undibacterium sp. 5I1]MEB0030875.1 YihY family inner membrane protein [Undibacterium sp. RTI2.1]MEB0117448.1 YihY family inner membrane protein [Undibacterium sp. RTI2.2]MEB0232595.1 YihY family inner membrane protein [Undibacterium sp. 10I3]MEB0259591.1 YihY family inner membrane protein [Undibacterium sp. 5I1]
MRKFSWGRMRNLFQFAYQRLLEGRLPQVAGSLTFTTVLALVPILTIALAIFTAFPLFNTFRSSLEAYFIKSLMPREISNVILGYLTQFATKATRLSAVGGVALMVTAVATLAMIDKSFNQIWQVKRTRPLIKRILVYWAIVTLGPLLIGVSITVTSYLVTATSGVVGVMPMAGDVFYTLISVLFTTIAFTLLYMGVPNRTVDWHDAIWGGLFAAIAFEMAKRLFAVFVTKFPTYTVVYGALAAVPIFLVWIYLSWLITLIGAVIAAALPIVKFERWWHKPAPGSAFIDAIEILKVLFIARNAQDAAAVDVSAIRIQTRFGMDEIDGLLEQMLEVGWVARVVSDAPESDKTVWWKKLNDDAERWVLLANPAQLKLADIYRLFVFKASTTNLLAKQTEQVIEQGLQQSLESYFSGLQTPA